MSQNEIKKNDQEVPETEGEQKTEVVVVQKEKFIKKLGKAIAKPFKFVGRTLKESPVATMFGAIGGAGLALGGKVLLEHYLGKRGEPEEAGDAIEIDDAGEYTTDDNMDEAV